VSAAVVERRRHLGTPPAVPGAPEADAAQRLRLRSLLRVAGRVPYRSLDPIRRSGRAEQLAGETHLEPEYDPEPPEPTGRMQDSDLESEKRMDERSARFERRFELPIVIAALLVIPIIIIEQSSAGEPWTTLAAVGNWVVWFLFLAEVVVMLAVAPDRRQWLRAHPLEIAIVILTPPRSGLRRVRRIRRLYLGWRLVGGDDDDDRRLRGHHARHQHRPLHCDPRHGGRHRLPHAPDRIRVGDVPRGRAAGEVAEVELELEEDVVAAKQEILAELRAIGDRLKELELRVERVV
jgi:hypothetical protein